MRPEKVRHKFLTPIHYVGQLRMRIHIFALRKMENNSLYNFEGLLPPGITNSVNNCYASTNGLLSC